jgi:hypothetical protein
MDMSSVTEMQKFAPEACAGCLDTDCKPQGSKCAACCEMLRVHMVVRGIVRNNPLNAKEVIGLRSEKAMDDYIFAHQDTVQGAYVFSSPSYDKTTFLVQQNSTTLQIRGEFVRVQMRTTMQMQVQASREIARQLIFNNESVSIDVDLKEFAHPAFEIS